MSHLVPLDRRGEFAERPSFHAVEDLGHRGLGDAEIGGDLMLRPAEHGQVHGAEFARANPRARVVTVLPATATSTARRQAHGVLRLEARADRGRTTCWPVNASPRVTVAWTCVGIDLHRVTGPPEFFGRDDRGAAATERVIDGRRPPRCGS